MIVVGDLQSLNPTLGSSSFSTDSGVSSGLVCCFSLCRKMEVHKAIQALLPVYVSADGRIKIMSSIISARLPLSEGDTKIANMQADTERKTSFAPLSRTRT